MEIAKTIDNKTLTLALHGRLDTTTAPALETELKASIEGIEELIFDLTDLEYIASAGLRVLLSSQKIMNHQGTMIIRNVSEAVMEVFDITGFTDILTIE